MLVYLLESEALPGVLVLDEVDGSVRPVGNELHHLEVLLAGSLALEVLPGYGAGPGGVFAVRTAKIHWIITNFFNTRHNEITVQVVQVVPNDLFTYIWYTV